MARKKSAEVFRKEFNKYYGRNGEYTQLSEYVDSRTHIKVRHEVCGLVYLSPPSSILQGRKCRNRDCYAGKSPKTFEKEFYEMLGTDYKLLSTYERFDVPVKVYHSVCDSIYKTRPTTILSGCKCPICNKIQRTKSPEKYQKDFKDIYGDEYKLLSEYVNGDTYVKVKHISCGREYNLRAKNLYQRARCLDCYGTPRKTSEQFKKELLEVRGESYTLVDDYVNSSKRVKIKHRCGNIMYIRPSDILAGVNCTKCYGFKVRDEEEIKEILNEAGYSLIGKYVNITTPVRIKHDYCGTEYDYIMSNFISGYRCQFCVASSGENLVAEYLRKNDIKYQYQKSYPDCRNVRPLPFDFYLQDYNLLIEYDGIQHFESIDYFGGADTLKQQQHRDNIKNTYAKENNINLLRIPYTEKKNITEIIDNKLKSLSKT